jgi:hypothetical protein
MKRCMRSLRIVVCVASVLALAPPLHADGGITLLSARLLPVFAGLNLDFGFPSSATPLENGEGGTLFYKDGRNSEAEKPTGVASGHSRGVSYFVHTDRSA